MRLYRLTTSEWARSLDGEGARKWGGRWNSIGIPAIYSGLAISTTLLEALVHLDPDDFPEEFTLVTYELPDDVSQTTVPLSDFPTDWRNNRDTPWFRNRGDRWLSSGASLLLLTPSVIVPSEYNAIINPRHAEMTQVRIANVEAFPMDLRFRH